jgi:hypothetical protein
MLDINGQELREGDDAQLLCQVVEVKEQMVVVRIMNSEMLLSIGAKQDEVLGGLVADSELTFFRRGNQPGNDCFTDVRKQPDDRGEQKNNECATK